MIKIANKILLVVSLLLFKPFCFGQNQNNQWNFGYNCNLNFNTVPPSSNAGNQMQTLEGSASIADATTGALLFYTDGITVWNANNIAMPNGTGLLGGNTLATNPSNPFSSTAAAVIVPKPTTPNIYYLITIDQEDSSNGLRYSVVDMTLNGGLGDIVVGEKNIALYSTTSEKLQAVPNASGCGYWLLTLNSAGNAFVAFSITQTGIDNTPVVSSVATTQPDGRGHFKINQEFTKIAMGNSGFFENRIELYDFNNATGTVANPLLWNYSFPYSGLNFAGIAFSPDGTKLYVSNFVRIIQYDISLTTAAQIQASGFNVTQAFPLLTLPGTMQLGPDNKIYVASNPLSVINSPNNSGATCDCQLNPIANFQGTVKYGLPQKIYALDDAVVINSIVQNGSCEDQAISFSIQNTSNIVSVVWDFDDIGSGVANNTSNSLTPQHTFANPGNYAVSVDVNYACKTTTLLLNVIVDAATIPTFGSISAFCSGATPPILPTTSSNGITGSWLPSLVSNTANGTYTFTPDSSQCATAQTINVVVTPNIVPTFSPIPTICFGTTPPILPTLSNEGITGAWSPAIVSNSANGIHVFTPNAGQCITTNTIITTVIACSNSNQILYDGNCQNTSINFSLQDNTGIVAVDWTFGEVSSGVNNLGTGLNPQHFYTNSGTFTVTATVSLASSTYTVTEEIIVLPFIPLTFSFPINYLTGASIPLLPTISDNGITGTWSPSSVDNQNSDFYTFTPDAPGCYIDNVVYIFISDFITPTFDPIPIICTGVTPPILPTTSTNGITGTWFPSTINNTILGNTDYTFTPDAGQTASVISISILVTNTLPSIGLTSISATSNQTVCLNEFIVPITYNLGLPATGATITGLPNGIFGSVSGDELTISGFSIESINSPYNFTITTTGGNCGSATISGTINVISGTTPSFDPIPIICAGTTPPLLPTIALNGITGAWSPATISNTTNGSYLFTPDAGQCATIQTLNITVIPNITPAFDPIPTLVSCNTTPILPNNSLNGIIGTWSPSTIDNTANGIYTFTPNTGQCATIVTITVNVNQQQSPDFDDLSLCANAIAYALPSSSPNGFLGTWTPSTINFTTSGSYTFIPNLGQCASAQTITITINPDNLTGFQWVVSAPFSDNATITVTPNNPGDYLYQLDFGPKQTANVFENVPSGIHSVTVFDENGCSSAITENDILVINYPKFFTPNGDGFNEIWNINELFFQRDSQIFIYDRYGKLLKQIYPFGSGWDGKYNNNDMPADDYWFIVDYEYNNVRKQFKAHFTLKR